MGGLALIYYKVCRDAIHVPNATKPKSQSRTPTEIQRWDSTSSLEVTIHSWNLCSMDTNTDTDTNMGDGGLWGHRHGRGYGKNYKVCREIRSWTLQVQ